MASNKSDCKPIAATIAASLLMLVCGLTYRILAARMHAPLTSTPITPDALEEFPMQIAGWIGQDVPLDEAIMRKTDADAVINRRYSRRSGSESISLYAACGVRIDEMMQHRPEVCYIGAGWVLADCRSMEMPLCDGRRLPCNIFQFLRGGLDAEKVTVLNYFIADGQQRGNVSLLQSRVWRVLATVDYVAQVQIVAPTETLTDDSATTLVCAFVVDQQYTGLSDAFGGSAIADLQSLLVQSSPHWEGLAGQACEAQPVQVLSDGQSSFSLCLYALLGLGLCRSAPLVKKLSFACIPSWYHDGGPFQIGHSLAISPDCLCTAPVCFVQPEGITDDLPPPYDTGILSPFLRKSLFTPTVLASRGPPFSVR